MRSFPIRSRTSTTLAALVLLGLSARAGAQVLLTNASDKTLLLHPGLSCLKGTLLAATFTPLHPEGREKRQGIELLGGPPTGFITVDPGRALRLTFNVDAANPSLGYTVCVSGPASSFLFKFALVHQVNSLKEPREEHLHATGLEEQVEYPHTLKQVAPGQYVFDKVQVEGKAEPLPVRSSSVCVIL
jgi:hypothetical protein